MTFDFEIVDAAGDGMVRMIHSRRPLKEHEWESEVMEAVIGGAQVSALAGALAVVKKVPVYNGRGEVVEKRKPEETGNTDGGQGKRGKIDG